MSSNQNKLSQFWQELKRRKVVRVITVYAAAAFVILELVSIIVEPLKLPEWFLPMVIVLLCIGFIIAIILSWIYDIHPEGGIVKTEPARKVKEDDKPVTSNSWKIASYISFVVIVGLMILNIIPRANNKKILEKSIAVLPLEYLSEDPNKQYLANGVLDAITGHLSMIEGLRVMPRTSVEQYRENRKSAKEIGAELDVSYLIVGSFLMIEDQVKLTIQLVVAEEGDHVFFREYDINYTDIIAVQSEVVQTIAKEIEVAISPEEKQLIEKIPTTNLTAHDFYQRGREEYWSSLLNREYWSRLEKAEYFFNKALEYDPDYASAYAGLAMVYYSRYFTATTSGDQYSADYYVSKNLDTMNLLAKKALLLDDQIADVYFAKGMYEQESGNLDESLDFFEQALNINPNHAMALTGAASTYRYLYDYVNGTKLIHEAERLERGALLPIIYNDLSGAYENMDFYEKSLQYLNHLLSITGDSITYYLFRYVEEFLQGNQEVANKLARSAFAVDSTSIDAILYMGRAFLDSKRYEEAYSYYSRYFSQLETTGDLDVNDMNRMGHTLWMVGQRDEARFYFSQMIDHCRRHIEMNSSYGRTGATFDIAGVYAFLGEKDSAYFYLEELTRTNWQVSYSLNMLNGLDPLFESIRQEERFQQLVGKMKTKHQAEHERVRKWLEENDR